ncbi:bile acid:sodium symporter [Frankia sp. AgB32]|uniref:bile acid:sodium symporter n=1 Tax=Frankia sp. AgB32 TaxID=631119 RepID=UPI00200E2B68|nr:bile acid:sodium symporter [Frankia sp. AgB32]MCK9897141.1 bile acid:sodium symporter [Frankia sp. AgB32]
MTQGVGERVACRAEGIAAALERRQVALYLATIGVGVVVGRAAAAVGTAGERAISPVLAGLLFVTFLQVPAAELARSLRAGRFVAAVLVVNFVVVPAVVAAMFPFLPGERAVRLGVLLVLLCPCVDWVVVFSGLAGARARQVLAVTPLLLVVQFLLLPVYLVAFLGPGFGGVVGAGPFLRAFALLIVVPLAGAWLAQAWAVRRAGGLVATRVAGAAMVPLMVATLLVVVASQVPRLRGGLGDLARVAPFYVLFLLVMAGAGAGVARAFRLDVPASRAVVFSGAARNSLVVLPLALALPAELAIGAVAVVTQTLVEVLGMVVYVHLIPRLLPAAGPTVEHSIEPG